MPDLRLSLSDLYPDLETARRINAAANPRTTYLTTPINAARIGSDIKGVRTMVSSFHHMKPATAHQILKAAKEASQPIYVFE